MIDQKTLHYQLPLPHPTNKLQDDVLRLRSAINNLDGLLSLTNLVTIDLPFVTADGTARPIRMTKNG